MNKKTIWLIVVLMSTAVIGVFLLQVSLIVDAKRENERQFELQVREVLNEVSEALKEKERRDQVQASISGFRTRYVQRNLLGGFSSPSALLDFNLDLLRLRDNEKELFDKLLVEPELRALYSNNDYYSRTLEERIDPEFLDMVLRNTFANRNIDPQRDPKYQYHYGIYSAQKEAFVIEDGHFLIEDERPSGNPNPLDTSEKNLYNTDLRVTLFPKEETVLGEIRLFFPNRSTIIWSSLWQNILGLLLFTAIILFSFFYTLNIVFRQKKVSEMKTDFINNMTHEFKTPIATISLASDSMISPKISGDAEKVRRFANIIQQENKRMNAQVEKVLQMALLEKEDFNLKVSDINLHEIIDRAVENIGLQVEKKEGTARAELLATNPVIEGDATHISNVINNLLDNANKYSPEKPEISVHTRNVANGVEVIIKDQGLGMSKEAKKHIFDKFYRVHTGNLHDIKGFGLGLSYVKAIMTAHKGQIDVKSELGKGSSFILTFPNKHQN
ncbi:MAG TPA: HAMP domain-containing sensor histidine kinase [Saprospiraceae bacterium]|nr:HAMP domain-containing sensor histidine kinase [Saprospiraceae bacterium]